ncbi:hypothetical protein KL905_004967 [Ogataea polymorpha]|uniref:Serine/threonine-protein kinase RIO1 n=2 Tax=Ogataea polymorpha TaxID=460523 RepID=A0A9P8PJ36_9ASCO|nr:hypothetical protein KL937_004981 [Ogataea polymorpha]KAG7886182.1 hypothetical protein KL936_005099 [Ogataea polymorpha]KAG7888663.1 hypothetical protein KL908_005023 [Ogataea polymorpha]KAG7897571.1 hypothetical protein KL935_005001 [Ogataea polymorpha]KAG7913698.1 hypothetical protein KL927_005284 [Ogataea polymorpha]
MSDLNLDDLSLSDSDYSSDEGISESDSFRGATHQALKEKTELLDKYASQIKVDQIKHRVTRDKAERATVEQVLDPRTLRFLSKLFKNGTITEINGCISTGKEANVYYALNSETGKEYAVKIYKTSILVFKDRERYVDGEFRFRNTRNQSNPRKMVRLWAEKEFRNLKRLHSAGIPSPEPVDLKSHVLVMEYLSKGDGWPSPKLKDYEFQDDEEIARFYIRLLIYMRWLYQKCRLVHADLSEYNTIVHKGELYVFDVSQSVEPDHQMSMDFLRMDIKNVNDFFSRTKNINVFPERMIFRFVIDSWSNLIAELIPEKNDRLLALDDPENLDLLEKYLATLPHKTEDDQEDIVFRSLHLVSSLNHLEERDFDKFKSGQVDTLRDLVKESSSEEEDDDEETNEESYDEVSHPEDSEDEEVTPKGKKYEDKESKKERKKAAKEAAREKRKTKMKKHVKKKLTKKGHK